MRREQRLNAVTCPFPRLQREQPYSIEQCALALVSRPQVSLCIEPDTGAVTTNLGIYIAIFHFHVYANFKPILRTFCTANSVSSTSVPTWAAKSYSEGITGPFFLEENFESILFMFV